MIWIGTTIKWLVSSETDLSTLKKNSKEFVSNLLIYQHSMLDTFPILQ